MGQSIQGLKDHGPLPPSDENESRRALVRDQATE